MFISYLIWTDNAEVIKIGTKTVFNNIFGNWYNGKTLLPSKHMDHIRIKLKLGWKQPQEGLVIFFIEFRSLCVLSFDKILFLNLSWLFSVLGCNNDIFKLILYWCKYQQTSRLYAICCPYKYKRCFMFLFRGLVDCTHTCVQYKDHNRDSSNNEYIYGKRESNST